MTKQQLSRAVLGFLCDLMRSRILAIPNCTSEPVWTMRGWCSHIYYLGERPKEEDIPPVRDTYPMNALFTASKAGEDLTGDVELLDDAFDDMSAQVFSMPILAGFGKRYTKCRSDKGKDNRACMIKDYVSKTRKIKGWVGIRKSYTWTLELTGDTPQGDLMAELPKKLLEEVIDYRAATGKWGGKVAMDPGNYRGLSDT